MFSRVSVFATCVRACRNVRVGAVTTVNFHLLVKTLKGKNRVEKNNVLPYTGCNISLYFSLSLSHTHSLTHIVVEVSKYENFYSIFCIIIMNDFQNRYWNSSSFVCPEGKYESFLRNFNFHE